MQVTLSERAERMVRARVACGEYSSPEAVIEAALARLDEDAYWADVRAKVAEGRRDLAEGRTLPWSDVRARLQRMIEAKTE